MAVTQPASLTDHVAAYPKGAPVQGAVFLSGLPAIVRETGEIEIGAPDKPMHVDPIDEGGVLCSTKTGTALVTGDDNGRVIAIAPDGRQETLHETKGAWIDALAARTDGSLAWSAGKTVFARDTKGTMRTTSVPTTARGLAFAPKGYRLAIAHYNGASLWFPNTQSPLDVYEWKGSHIDVTVSPDGRFLVTSMQENALHAWRINDRANMRMSGYPGKVRSLAWSSDGDWLATSGADSCVIWPFRDKDGPMNKNPHECAVRKAKITRVAFHPKDPLLAVGYEDGWVLMCRLTDNAELLVRRPDADRAAISALAWAPDGNRLLFGTDSGEAFLLTLPP